MERKGFFLKLAGALFTIVLAVSNFAVCNESSITASEESSAVARWQVASDSKEEKIVGLRWAKIYSNPRKADPKCVDDIEMFPCAMVYQIVPGLILEVSTYSPSTFTGNSDGKSYESVEFTFEQAYKFGIDPEVVKRNTFDQNLNIARESFYLEFETEARDVDIYSSNCNPFNFEMTQPHCQGPRKTGLTEKKIFKSLVLKKSQAN